MRQYRYRFTDNGEPIKDEIVTKDYFHKSYTIGVALNTAEWQFPGEPFLLMLVNGPHEYIVESVNSAEESENQS